MVGGCLVDDIGYYNRVHEQFDIMTSEYARNNTASEGFGYRWDSTEVYNTFTTSTLPGTAPKNATYPYNSMNACFKPL
jgi:hypothetical protein